MTSGAVWAEEAIAAPATAQNLSLSAALGQHEERLALREPSRRPAQRVAEDPVKRRLRDRLVGERPHHAPQPHHLLKLHGRSP